MMDRIVIKNYLDDYQEPLEEAITSKYVETPRVEPKWWYRYENPFERKWSLDKQVYNDMIFNEQAKENRAIITDGILTGIMSRLAHSATCWWVSRLLDVPIEYGDINHYGGVFVYDVGDYLKPHVDAGLHPKSHQRKIATAVLYLTPAQLVFWKGDVAWLDSPTISQVDHVYNLPANTLVLFTNHDTQYHEVPVVRNEPRVCITVSYIAPPDFTDPRFMNQRTRAYFARHISQEDTPEIAQLRNKRASEEHHSEVYRT